MSSPDACSKLGLSTCHPVSAAGFVKCFRLCSLIPYLDISVFWAFFFWLLLLAYAPLLGSPSVDLFRRSNMKGTMNDGTYSPDYSLASVDLKSFKNNLVDIIQQNKERWKELAAQGIVVYKALLLSLSVLTLPLGFCTFSP